MAGKSYRIEEQEFLLLDAIDFARSELEEFTDHILGIAEEVEGCEFPNQFGG